MKPKTLFVESETAGRMKAFRMKRKFTLERLAKEPFFILEETMKFLHKNREYIAEVDPYAFFDPRMFNKRYLDDDPDIADLLSNCSSN